MIGNFADRFFKMLNQDFITQGIIGPANSKTTLAFHQFNTKYFIPQVSAVGWHKSL